jgi:uncharacterized protein (TIGR02452 family)
MASYSKKHHQHKGRKDHNRDKYNKDSEEHWRQNELQEKYEESRSALVAVFKDTVTFFTKKAQFDYVIPRPFCYTFESLKTNKTEIKPILINGEKMKVFVENIDTLKLANRFIDEGNMSHHIMILNMASKYKPGGGVRSGALAQEEELFRRTNYFLHLPTDLYELDTDDFIYSRSLIVVKGIDYNMLPLKFTCNSLAVAGLKNPPLNHDGTYKDPRHYDIIYNKIHGIFKIAYLNQQKYLVLGSLSCGAYGNDARIIASIFRKIVKEFNGCFKTVSFAVLCGRDTYNYDTFKEEVEYGFKVDT